MSALKLRAGTVVQAQREHPGEQRLLVELEDGERRPAIADTRLHGDCALGDKVVVNVQALDIGLGSGGFDVLHVNLTRGLLGESSQGSPAPDQAANVSQAMKLNYTSLQHLVDPVDGVAALELPVSLPVGVLALHGQLAAVAWAYAQERPRGRLGYVQTAGGALPGGHSRAVAALRERELLSGHLSAGVSYGGEGEAITIAGAIHHGARSLGWDAIVCGPGPGIVGSGSPLGNGGLQALESAHTALALGAPTLLVARMSSADPRARHRGVSHHTLTVLELLLAPVAVALPLGVEPPVGGDSCAQPGGTSRPGQRDASRHDWRSAPVDLAGYAASGLPSTTMGRGIAEDPLFFAAALAGGSALASLCQAVQARNA
ncbi:MAG TPA: DUF3866 family protein [Solirubrobacteraceae bacterium]|jgi:hypothetical protein|nr:DUF3866 family protein [Solirubrobacteraceae bacterium]